MDHILTDVRPTDPSGNFIFHTNLVQFARSEE
jgi:hypothetical protein